MAIILAVAAIITQLVGNNSSANESTALSLGLTTALVFIVLTLLTLVFGVIGAIAPATKIGRLTSAFGIVLVVAYWIFLFVR